MDFWQALWIYTHFEPLPPVFWQFMVGLIILGWFGVGLLLLGGPFFLPWDQWLLAAALRLVGVGMWILAGGIFATAWLLGLFAMEE